MTPYYSDDAVTILSGDSSKMLNGLPRDFDAVVTDPPYGVGFDYGEGEHDDKQDGYIEWLWPIIEEAESHVRAGGYMVVYQAARNARKWTEWFPREWRPVALPKMFVQMMPTAPQWATDYALLWRVPGGEKIKYQPWMPQGNRDWYVSRTPNFGLGRKSIDHPCPRPVDAVRYLIQLVVPPGGSVLDPFLGSGTTLRAAKDLGRRGTGIEINEKWCKVAADRMPQESLWRDEEPAA